MAKDLSFSITNLLNLKDERDQKCNDSGFAEETITQNLTPNTPPTPNTHTERGSRSCGLTPSVQTYSRTRARRTKWSSQLLEKMHVMFDTVDRKPSHRQIMEDLAGGDELLASKIQIWFQNKRATVKKQNKIKHTDHSGKPSSACRRDLSPTSSHPTTATPHSSSQFTMVTISSSPASNSPTSMASKFRHTKMTSVKRATRHGDVIQTVMSECPVMTSTPTRERTPTRGSAVDTEGSSSSYNTPMTISEHPAKRQKAAYRGPYADFNGDSSKAENPTVKSESGTRPFDFHSAQEEILRSHPLGFTDTTPNFPNHHFNTRPPTFPNHHFGISPAFPNHHFGISPAFPNHHLNNSSNFHNHHVSGSVGISPVTPHLGISGFSPLAFASSPVLASGQSSARMHPVGFTMGSFQETRHSGSNSQMGSREANQSSGPSVDSIRQNPVDVRATSLGSNVYLCGPPCSPQTYHHGYLFSSPAVTSYTSRASFSDQWSNSNVTNSLDLSPTANQPGSAFRPFQRSANLLDPHVTL